MAMITADPQDVPKVGSFSFTPDSMAKVKELIANYPPGRQASAVIGVLDLAQRQQAIQLAQRIAGASGVQARQQLITARLQGGQLAPRIQQARLFQLVRP